MPVPLVLAAPAAAAGLAYLNARTGFWYDVLLGRCATVAFYRIVASLRRDRLSLFYTLERFATSPASAARAMLWFEGVAYSYAEVYDAALRYGSWLRERHGVKAGDVVAMDMVNSQNFVFMWFGLWAIGAKPAFINYNLTGTPLAHCLKVAGTKLCIVDVEYEASITPDVREANKDIVIVPLTQDLQLQALATDAVRSPDEDRSEDKISNMAILIYTSGTTGLPKPGIVSWGKVLAGATLGQILTGRSGADSIMYTSMPLYHSSASILSLSAGVLGGSTQALGRKFSTRAFWDDVRASNATSIQYVGETLRYLLSAPPQHDPVTGECLDRRHRVKAAFGNGLRPDVWNAFKERFGVATIVEFYAATESPFGTWNVSSNDFGMGAMGRRGWIFAHLANQSTALVEVDWDTARPRRDPVTGFCRRVPLGEPGEALAKLDEKDPRGRYQGYYGNEGATESRTLRDVFKKGDLWYRSGDVMRWTADGFIFFHDRLGDTFRWKSENVSTTEVSQAVGTHPAVREANVYGVSLPHHDGRAGCAAIWLDTTGGDGAGVAATLRSLARHVRAELPRYAQPQFLRVQRGDAGSGEHMTGTNKQQKHKLREAGVRPPSGGALGEKNDDCGGAAAMGDLYWLQGEDYVPFGEKEWRELEAGRVKL